MKKNVLSIILALTLLALTFTVALAQDATPTPPTWQPPLISKAPPFQYLAPGSVVNFSITAVNSGPIGNAPTWQNVVITDQVSPKLVNCVAITVPPGPIVSWVGNDLTVDIGNLAPQDLVTIQITCDLGGGVGYGEYIGNRASMEYDTPDGVHQGPLFSNMAWVLISGIEGGKAENPEAPADAPMVPEASTLLLLGSAASGMAGYVSLQIRARRRTRR